MSYSRFAIYFVPPEGPLATFGASWLGWDVIRGRDVVQPDVPGLRDITMTPQKYGFHGTLKPPFRLAEGASVEGLIQATANLSATLRAAQCDGLELTTIGHFLALTPRGDLSGLRDVAASCVRTLDPFRAPAPADELARRRAAGLTSTQEAYLLQWGYPYVMDAFKFHLTLTGKLPENSIAHWSNIVRQHLPALPTPFTINQIALCGEREDGRFELLHRYTLSD